MLSTSETRTVAKWTEIRYRLLELNIKTHNYGTVGELSRNCRNRGNTVGDPSGIVENGWHQQTVSTQTPMHVAVPRPQKVAEAMSATTLSSLRTCKVYFNVIEVKRHTCLI